MWAPRKGTFHHGKTEANYSNLIALHERYKTCRPPIQELKDASLADGYPPEKVAKMRYPDLSHIDVHSLLRGIVTDTDDTHSDSDNDEETSPPDGDVNEEIDEPEELDEIEEFDDFADE